MLNNAQLLTAKMLSAVFDEIPKNDSVIETGKKIRPFWQVEKEAIVEAIEFCDGNVGQAAEFFWKSVKQPFIVNCIIGRQLKRAVKSL